jgi:carbon starvation protein CstA
MKELLAFLAIILIIVTVIGIIVLQPYFESRAYNKFTTGQKATYWDAVWTELRVMSK